MCEMRLVIKIVNSDIHVLNSDMRLITGKYSITVGLQDIVLFSLKFSLSMLYVVGKNNLNHFLHLFKGIHKSCT